MDENNKIEKNQILLLIQHLIALTSILVIFVLVVYYEINYNPEFLIKLLNFTNESSTSNIISK